jgi:adenylate kinase
MLGRAYRGVCVSTGNLLRAEVKAESDLGAIAEEQMKKGNLLPSKLLISLIRARLAHRYLVHRLTFFTYVYIYIIT